MNSSNIKIRSEIPGDEECIDNILCHAFAQIKEAHLVRYLRSRYASFNERYSLTAWVDEQMVGYTLFVSADIRLMGNSVRALATGPVAVLPEFQRKGIAARLLSFGHELGKADSFSLAFVDGHPEYYTKLGYRPCCSYSRISINTSLLPPTSQNLTPLPVKRSDIDWLVACYKTEWQNVDFSWQWSNNFNDWTMHGQNALIWRTPKGKRAAYTLGSYGGKKWKMILGDAPDLVRDVIATIKPKSLDHHPSGWLAKNVLAQEWSTYENNLSPNEMACPLQPGALDSYFTALEAGRIQPGTFTWPLPYIKYNCDGRENY